MSNKLKNILLTILILFFFTFICLVIYEINDFITDYKCAQMPINDFFQEPKCKKYWGYR